MPIVFIGVSLLAGGLLYVHHRNRLQTLTPDHRRLLLAMIDRMLRELYDPLDSPAGPPGGWDSPAITQRLRLEGFELRQIRSTVAQTGQASLNQIDRVKALYEVHFGLMWRPAR